MISHSIGERVIRHQPESTSFVHPGDIIELEDQRLVSVCSTTSRRMVVEFDDDDSKYHSVYTVASCIDAEYNTVFAVKLKSGWYSIDLRVDTSVD